MKNQSFRFLLLLAIASLFGALAARAEAVLAGNPGIAGQTLDAEGIKAVLLGKKPMLGNVRVVVIIAKTGDAQEAFLKDRVGMSASQFQTHWRRLFMTGGGTAPKIVETEAEACKLAAETPGGVVIADRAAIGGLAVLAGK